MAERPQNGTVLQFEGNEYLVDRRTEHSHVQLVKTPHHGRVLLMDQEVQFAESDEYRYHEMLIHPPLSICPPTENTHVLILGGGDGLAAREVLKWNPGAITVVDYDRQFVDEVVYPYLTDLNENVFSHPRVQIIHANAIEFCGTTSGQFDVVVMDLPDPEYGMIHTYMELIECLRNCLSPNGVVVLHTGGMTLNPRHPCWDMLWMFEDRLKAIFTQTHTVHFRTAHIPSFVHPWGFLYLLPKERRQRPSYEVRCDCKFWDPMRNPAHRLVQPEFYIGDRDIDFICDECGDEYDDGADDRLT
jgi:spermidine synthase